MSEVPVTDVTNVLLIAGMILLYTLQSLFCKMFTDRYPGKPEAASPVFAVVSGLFVACLSVILTGFHMSFSPLTLMIGLVNGVTLMIYDFSMIGASKNGPYSILMVFMISGGIVIPAVVSALFLDVPVSAVKIVCIAVVLLSVYLMTRKETESFTDKKKFFFWCVLLGLGNGVYGTCFKIQEYLISGGRIENAEHKELVALTYVIAAILSFGVTVIQQKKDTLRVFTSQTKSSILFLVACSLVMAAAVNLYVYILPLIDVNVLNTLDNACVFLLSVLCSVVFFKEKLSAVNVVGCLTMTAALVCISVF